jgi:hypothetical protein
MSSIFYCSYMEMSSYIYRGEDLNVEVYDVRQMDAKWWQKLTWPLARWANKYWLPFIISQEIWLSTFYTIYSIYLCPFQNCVWQTRPPFKMAAVIKNRNFFNWPLLLYYKSKWAQFFTAATYVSYCISSSKCDRMVTMLASYSTFLDDRLRCISFLPSDKKSWVTFRR